MKILLLGPVHREKDFIAQNGKYPFLIGQGQQSWVEALEELGHRVTVFRYTDSIFMPYSFKVSLYEKISNSLPLLYARIRRGNDLLYRFNIFNYFINRKLLALYEKNNFDLIIISGGITNITPTTIKKLKFFCKSTVLLFSGINPQSSASKAEKDMVRRNIVDIVIENDRGYAKKWEEIGAQKTFVMPISSVDPKIHKKIILRSDEKEEYSCDVCFVGSISLERQQILKNLLIFNIKIWGDIPQGEKLISELKPFYKGKAYGKKMIKIFNSAKIVLNFQPKGMTHGGNMRTFEVLGSGAFQLTDKVDADWFKNNEELVLFSDTNDLIDKVNYYLTHNEERILIAEKGYVSSHKNHTYVKHFKKLFHYYEGN